MTDKNIMTLAEVNRQLAAKKRNKYNAVRCRVDGISFDSRREARYYVGLKAEKRIGEIVGFDCQVPFHFIFNGAKMFTYKADFVVYDFKGNRRIIDVKGVKTAVYRLKKKLIQAQHGITIEEA